VLARGNASSKRHGDTKDGGMRRARQRAGRHAPGFAAIALLACALAARADGPDVPYVPTPQVVVDEMLRVAQVGPSDYVMDLGSGDGRILITAATKFGARGLGVELDDDLLVQSNENARAAGVADRVRFRKEDLFQADLSPATVITMYLVPRVNRRLLPRLMQLAPGTRIVSHDFDLEGWKPDATTAIRKNVFLWIVPANVAGRWHARLELPGDAREIDMDLAQKHQEVEGYVRLGRIAQAVWQPKLEGERFRFTLVDDRDRENEASLYVDARVHGDAMEGHMRRGVGSQAAMLPFRAVRIGAVAR
jgi:hypothetical protein